jgi:uncharacterized damage-inducible protein DinB
VSDEDLEREVSNAVQSLTGAIGHVSQVYARMLMKATTRAIEAEQQVLAMGKHLADMKTALDASNRVAEAAKATLAEHLAKESMAHLRAVQESERDASSY